MQHRQVEQVIDIPVPQSVTEVVEVPKVTIQERPQQRQVEQIMSAPKVMMQEVI